MESDKQKDLHLNLGKEAANPPNFLCLENRFWYCTLEGEKGPLWWVVKPFSPTTSLISNFRTITDPGDPWLEDQETDKSGQETLVDPNVM